MRRHAQEKGGTGDTRRADLQMGTLGRRGGRQRPALRDRPVRHAGRAAPRPGAGERGRQRLRVRALRQARRARRHHHQPHRLLPPGPLHPGVQAILVAGRPQAPATDQPGRSCPRTWRPSAAAPRGAARPPGTAPCAAPTPRPAATWATCRADHPAPPFLVVVDVGHVIELYADFSGQGRNYTQFPSRQRLSDPARRACADPAIHERMRAVWEEPHALDPAIRSAEVTRDIARRLARVAAHLEARHEPEAVRASSCGASSRCSPRMWS